MKEFPDLKIHGGEGDLSHILVFFVIIYGFQLLEVFHDLSDFGCAIFVLGAFGTHVSRLSAAEAEPLLHTFLTFFGSEFSNFDDVYVHGIGVTSFGGGGEGVVRLMGGFRIPLRDFVSTFPLGLEGNGHFVPAVNGCKDGVHGHDLVHEGRRDASGEIPDKDVLVSDFGEGAVVLEVGYVFDEGQGIGIVFPFGHVFGGKPGDGGSSGVMVFECGFELGDEAREGSHSYGGS